MNVVEKIKAQYGQARSNLQAIIDKEPSTPQERYDYNKVVRRTGLPPQKRNAHIERMINDMRNEERFNLRGVMEVRDTVQKLYDTSNSISERTVLMKVLEVIGNAEEET